MNDTGLTLNMACVFVIEIPNFLCRFKLYELYLNFTTK